MSRDVEETKGGGRSPAEGSLLGAILPYLLLSLVSLLVYWQIPELGFMSGWDDELYLVNRPEVRDWWGASWYHRLLTPELGYPVPIPTLLHYLTRQVPPSQAVLTGHLLNLAFHLLNVGLVYRLACRWLERSRPAVAVALLWATHPLLVETVAWLTNLKGLMLAFFSFGAFLAWERAMDEPASYRWRVATVVCFLGALGCRPEAVVIGPFFVLRTWTTTATTLHHRRNWIPLSIIGGLSLVYLPVSIVGQFTRIAEETIGPADTLSLGERIANMGAALTIQLRHVFFPFGLQPSYLPDYPGRIRDAWIGLGLGVSLVVATVAVGRKLPRTIPGWGLWWLFYLPASGVVYLPRFTADTYMYIPLAGLLLVGVPLVRSFIDDRPRVVSLSVAAAAGVLLVFWGGIAHVQTLRWRNPLTLWKPVLERYPDHPKAKWMVAGTYVDAGAYAKAAAIYRRSYTQLAGQGRLSLKAAIAFEKTGAYRDAALVAVDILSYPGKKNPHAEQFLVRIVSQHDIFFEPGRKPYKKLIEAAEKLVGGNSASELEGGLCRRAASYFERLGQDRLASMLEQCARGAAPP